MTMQDATLTQTPIVRTGMRIRRSPAEVFEAFVDPAITSRFWFTHGSARLEAGREVRWEWEMYGVGIPVAVKEVEPSRRIAVEWPGEGTNTLVEWDFQPLEDGTTFVTITNSGLIGDGDSLARQVADSTEGFCLVLAGAKALLEHGIELNLVVDRFPQGLPEP
jgi:uncharacterized protein YndB with AHSA1/START domain